MIPVLGIPERRWVCPNCSASDVTYEIEPHTRFHSCRGLNGITAPFIPEGVKVKVEAKEREDYVNKEEVTLDGNGRPIMSVVTTYEDGRNDCAVMAPVAKALGEAYNT